MPLFLDDDQTMLRDTARDFVADRLPVAHLRALRDAADPDGFDRGRWREFAEMGFTGILVPESAGGLGLGHVEAGIVLEEIGRNLSPSPFLHSAVAGAAALAGTAADRWLPRIAAGDAVVALAIDEGPKHAPARTAMRATPAGNGFRLDGVKTFVAHGHVADLLIVAARTAGAAGEQDGITLFAVAADQAGLAATPQRLADASLAARVDFDGVVVDGDAVIGDVDGGWAGLSRLLDAGRAGAAAELLGLGGGAMDLTMNYLRERRQFGQPIGSFQALQHRAAHLYCEMEVAHAAVLKAQHLLDEGDEGATRAVHVAKAQAGLATTLAVQEGVQMHGGVGMTDAFDIGLYMKRQRVLAEMFGDANHHADALARMSGY